MSLTRDMFQETKTVWRSPVESSDLRVDEVTKGPGEPFRLMRGDVLVREAKSVEEVKELLDEMPIVDVPGDVEFPQEEEASEGVEVQSSLEDDKNLLLSRYRAQLETKANQLQDYYQTGQDLGVDVNFGKHLTRVSRALLNENGLAYEPYIEAVMSIISQMVKKNSKKVAQEEFQVGDRVRTKTEETTWRKEPPPGGGSLVQTLPIGTEGEVTYSSGDEVRVHFGEEFLQDKIFFMGTAERSLEKISFNLLSGIPEILEKESKEVPIVQERKKVAQGGFQRGDKVVVTYGPGEGEEGTVLSVMDEGSENFEVEVAYVDFGKRGKKSIPTEALEKVGSKKTSGTSNPLRDLREGREFVLANSEDEKIYSVMGLGQNLFVIAEDKEGNQREFSPSTLVLKL